MPTTSGNFTVSSGATVSATVAANLVTWTETAKTGDYTVVAADTGTMFTTTGASGAVIFTLPTKAAGLRYRFLNVVDQNMTVASAGSADDIVGMNDVAADSIAFSTAGEKIGACLEVFCNGAATKWYAFNISAGANTATVA